MRSIKILLILLLSYIKEEEEFLGMCLSASELRDFREISHEEHLSIKEYLKNNKPVLCMGMVYWWNRGDKEPRIEWLEKQIKLLEDS